MLEQQIGPHGHPVTGKVSNDRARTGRGEGEERRKMATFITIETSPLLPLRQRRLEESHVHAKNRPEGAAGMHGHGVVLVHDEKCVSRENSIAKRQAAAIILWKAKFRV